MRLTENEVTRLLNALALTETKELNCDEHLALVGRFAEFQRAGVSSEEAMHEVRQHLAICDDCREEYETLLAALGPVADGAE